MLLFLFMLFQKKAFAILFGGTELSTTSLLSLLLLCTTLSQSYPRLSYSNEHKYPNAPSFGQKQVNGCLQKKSQTPNTKLLPRDISRFRPQEFRNLYLNTFLTKFCGSFF